MVTSTGAEDIEQSLRILFGTLAGERFLRPKYGLNLQDVLFEPVNVTERSLLLERIRIGILMHEPRIDVLKLDLSAAGAHEGTLVLSLDYTIKATNSRFNLVYPFHLVDGAEVAP